MSSDTFARGFFAAAVLLAVTSPAVAGKPWDNDPIVAVPPVVQPGTVHPPGALNPAVGDAVMHDVGADLAGCAAFYNLGVAFGERDWPNIDQSAGKKAASVATTTALALLGSDVAMAHYKIALQHMTDTMAGDTHRVAIVNAEYGALCKDLLEHPEHRLAHWVEIENAAAGPK